MSSKRLMKVLLLGDSCEDEYIYGRCTRLSPEAPVPVLDYAKLQTKSGMAGNVCLNLQSFGLDITFLTNPEKIVKTRFIDEKSNQQILRVDNETRVKPLLVPVATNSFDAVVISDYNKGYLPTEKIFEIVESATCPVFIDSKKTVLPNKENCFVKINDVEYEKLQHDCYIDNLIVTKGSQGCVYKQTLYPAEKVNVYDVVGAGDTFLSALVYGYITTNNIDESLMMGNRAAAIAVQQPGTYILTEEDVQKILY
ncbi:putative carbohydrate kinase [Prochlorococcus phage P-SSM2]|nr:putative carbohydrate kinase [Prochlorococcus phage P-SSM2]AAX44687.1 putative carbohydrate kinase [Prochlorococcus phage P-SSM2]